MVFKGGVSVRPRAKQGSDSARINLGARDARLARLFGSSELMVLYFIYRAKPGGSGSPFFI